ncbi:hypothetical protein HOLleu_32842 [Holothuria leucospilota]|uniref:Uncharacterized protein n=1 Tax=Holothuria leucospilota TaxID=206669 RepID=A0A9Q1BJ99_HOLLE|nr:hypothetical protein HOLleu_32842 [Holothuria leucospilota]
MSRYLYSEKLEEKLDQGSEVLTEVKAKLRGFNLDTVGSSTQEPTPQEKEATTLFQELSTAFQGPKETAHSFVLRTLDLRQKVVFASQEAGAGVIYTYDQAQKMFLHTVSTGLQSDYVRQQLQPLLTQEGTTDEALLEALTVFVGQEAERAMKLKKSKVCQIKSDVKEIPHNERSKSTKPDASQAAGTNWEEMQSSIKEIIRAEISALQQKPSSDGKQRRPPQEWERLQTREKEPGKRERVTREGHRLTSSSPRSHPPKESDRVSGYATCGMISSNKRKKMTKLVGNRCLIYCTLNDVHTTALWDTGAQVSLVSEEWVKQHLPQTVVRPMEDLLDSEGLRLNTATGTPIGFQGWIEVKFQIPNATLTGDEIIVPMLVTEEILETPIIGYNVIEEMAQRGSMKSTQKQFCKLLPQMSYPQVNKLVNMLQTVDSEEMSTVKTKRNSVKVMVGETIIVRCTTHARAHEEVTTLFEPDENHQLPEGLIFHATPVTIKPGNSCQVGVPVTNNSVKDLVLPGRLCVGHIYSIRAVLPGEFFMDLFSKRDPETIIVNEVKVNMTNEMTNREKGKWLPAVDLSELTNEQRTLAEQMLTEECDAFAKDDDDLGCIPNAHRDQAGFVQHWKEAMKEAYELAKETSLKNSQKGKRYYDKGKFPSPLESGDRVLVRNFSRTEGPNKLGSYWEDKVYIVVKRHSPELPVYDIVPECGKGRPRTVHRNQLLPCDIFTPEASVKDRTSDRGKSNVNQRKPVTNGDSSESDSEDEEFYLVPGEHSPTQHEMMPSREVHKDTSEANQVINSGDLPELATAQMVPPQADQHPRFPEQQQQPVQNGVSKRQELCSEQAQATMRYPTRQRQPRHVFTYDQLGEPRLYQSGVNSMHDAQWNRLLPRN